MLPEIAVIRSCAEKTTLKLFGQHPIERNIRLLWQAGFKKIFLELDSDDIAIFDTTVKNKLGKILNNIEFGKIDDSENFLLIESSQFILFRHFQDPDEAFIKTGDNYRVKQDEEKFLLSDKKSFAKARKLAIHDIRNSVTGWLARNVNKRISIPISLLLVNTGIHPNVITFFNFLIGMTGAALMFVDDYRYVAASGILIQSASIFDGCDGEVAKMSSKFSQFGGLIDSLSDHSIALAAFIGSLFQVYYRFSLEITLAAAAVIFYGFALSMTAEFHYLFKFSKSRSFAAYTTEFYDQIPRRHRMIRFMDSFKYLIRKECYSFVGCVFCLAGLVEYFALFMGAVIAAAGSLQIITNIRFFPLMNDIRNDKAMVYVTRR